MSAAAELSVRVGCCGFRRGREEYFKRFSLVEVQHTFYDPPDAETLSGWRDEAPEGFRFTVKAWQLITHRAMSPTYARLRRQVPASDREYCGAFQPTPIVHDAMERTLESARALAATHVVFQCPASFSPVEENVESLQRFFRRFPPSSSLKYCWEPRGAWPEALIKELCDSLNLIHVVDPFDRAPLSAGERYYRVHVGKRGRYSYSDVELKELAAAVEAGVPTRVLFNNTEMLGDAARFLRLVRPPAAR